MRWLALAAGIALVVLAAGAVTRVADTREGLIAEIVTLFAGGAGVVLLIYGLAARPRPALVPPSPATGPRETPRRRRTNRDLYLGSGGVAVALLLLGGLAYSGGPLWAGFGLALLLPMLAGSVYLWVRFLTSEP